MSRNVWEFEDSNEAARERRAAQLKRRFSKISSQFFAAKKPFGPIFAAAVLICLSVSLSATIAYQSTANQWPVVSTAKHLLAGFDCGFTRWVGLAPARIGNPGYWPSNDADGDGVACEQMNFATSLSAPIAFHSQSTVHAQSTCHTSYSGACIPYVSDVDCAGGGGNGPYYVEGIFSVVGPDVYELDRDGDGLACQPYSH